MISRKIRSWGDPTEEHRHQEFLSPHRCSSSCFSAAAVSARRSFGMCSTSVCTVPSISSPRLRTGQHRQGKPYRSSEQGCGLDRVGQQQHAGHAGSGYRRREKDGLAWPKVISSSRGKASAGSLSLRWVPIRCDNFTGVRTSSWTDVPRAFDNPHCRRRSVIFNS